MEYYSSTCPDCGATYEWTGYKTGIGKTQQQLDQMTRDQTVCKRCGGERLKTTLASQPELDRFIGDVLETAVDACRGKTGG